MSSVSEYPSSLLYGPVLGPLQSHGNNMWFIRVLIELDLPYPVWMKVCLYKNPSGDIWAEDERIFYPREASAFEFYYLPDIDGEYKMGLVQIFSVLGQDKKGREISAPRIGLSQEMFSSVCFSIPSRDFSTKWYSVSCSKISYIEQCYRKGKSTQWDTLLADATAAQEEGFVLGGLIHTGDQVYLDEPSISQEKSVFKYWSDSLKMMHPDLKYSVQEDEILESFKNVYRTMGMVEPIRKIMAMMPNIWIPDDHNIRDDFGDEPHYTIHDADKYLISIAKRVLDLYITQLWRPIKYTKPVDFKGLVSTDHGFIVPPPLEYIPARTCFLFLDTRFERMFRGTSNGDTLVSTEGLFRQLSYLESLNRQPKKTSIKSIVVVSQVPFVMFDSSITGLSEHVVDDARGLWAHPEHETQFNTVMKTLIQTSKKYSVILLCGDVHMSGHSIIQDKHGSNMIYQMVTSPIANDTPSKVKILLPNIGSQISNVIGTLKCDSSWAVEHGIWHSKCNYGSLTTIPKKGVEFMGIHKQGEVPDVRCVSNNFSCGSRCCVQ